MNPLHYPAVNAFAETAQGFCAWCESSSLGDKFDAQAAFWLCKLYAAALALPKVGPENSDDLPDLPPVLLERAKNNLAIFNGRYYREFFNPSALSDGQLGMGDVGDDLLDTYKDIRSGLLLFEQGNTTEALWFWSFLHRIHWGRHAVGAIFALHCLSIGMQE